MKKTKNYAMPYPEQDDYFNVEDFQDMMVSVDDLMKKLSDSGAQISSDAEHLYNQTKAQMDNIQKRMNAFTALKEGSTTGDAELKDIRVAYDGKEYGNAGEAVREQASDIHKALFGAGASIWSKAKSESTKYVAETKGICILNERFTAAGVVTKISRGTFGENESTLNLDRECSAYIVEFEKNPGTVYMPSAETIKIVSTTKIIFEANGNARCWIPVEKGQYLAVDSTATAYECEDNQVPYMLYDQANTTLEFRGFGASGSTKPVDPYSLALECKLEYDMDDTGLVKQIDANREAAASLKEGLGEVFIIGKNQFDINNLVNKLYSNTGELTDNPSYLLTDFIDVSSKQGYYIASNYNGYFVQFDNSKAFISKIENILYANGRRIGSGTAYIRIGLGKKISEIQDGALWIEKEKITETPIYDKYGKNINNDVNVPHDNSKVDKSQGIENSGKYLKIGEDGNIVPDEVPIDDRMYVGEKIPNGGTKDGDQTISIGQGACRDNKCGIIAIGTDAASKTKSIDDSDNGHYSIAIGHRALQKNVTGDHNTAIGWGAMTDNYSGNGNTALGEDSLCHNREGNANTCVGNRAYQMGTGSRNVVIGASAMYTSQTVSEQPSGNENVSIGSNSGCPSGHGNRNVCVGHEAQTTENIEASVAIGYRSKARKSQQVVIGNTTAYKKTLETLLIGDIIIMGTDNVFRKLSFNEGGTISWTDVSADYADYIK